MSAVVPTYNKERNLRRLLGSLAEQKIARGALAEIVVVASGCAVSTLDWKRILKLALRHFTLINPKTNSAYVTVRPRI
ncbi:MAG TPA: glycosyltransferase [Candidatus Acidoferrum sp.]|nr:glycosyltransferase [Candidatus Acidoferrum sp.]